MSLEIKPGQTHIKSKAMVAWAAGEPLKMEEVDVSNTYKGLNILGSHRLNFVKVKQEFKLAAVCQ